MSQMNQTNQSQMPSNENQIYRGLEKLLSVTDKGTLAAFKRAVNTSYEADAYIEAARIAPWCNDFQLSIMQIIGILWATHRWTEGNVIKGHQKGEVLGKVVAYVAKVNNKETYAGMIDDLAKSTRSDLPQKLFWIMRMIKNKPIDFYDLCDMITYWAKEFRNDTRQARLVRDFYRFKSEE